VSDDYDRQEPIGEFDLLPGAMIEMRDRSMVITSGPERLEVACDDVLQEWLEHIRHRIQELDAESEAGARHEYDADSPVDITHVQLVPDNGGYQIWCTFRQSERASMPIWRNTSRRMILDFQTLDDDMSRMLPSFNNVATRPKLPSAPFISTVAARRRYKRSLEGYLRGLVQTEVCGQEPPRQLLLFLGILVDARWEMDGPTLEGWVYMPYRLAPLLSWSPMRRWLSIDAERGELTWSNNGQPPTRIIKIGRGCIQPIDKTKAVVSGLVVRNQATGQLGHESLLEIDTGDARSLQALVDLISSEPVPVMVPAEISPEYRVLHCCQLDWKVERGHTPFQRSWLCLVHIPQQTGGVLHIFNSLVGGGHDVVELVLSQTDGGESKTTRAASRLHLGRGGLSLLDLDCISATSP